ncbi:hypothetical protein [Kineococcus sp. SYSU DK003]|uniref:hypothetical protein n=1 Tax=Kineococcus sp. SYSU DK003 TaxID=3383124 RepID=UPI003D7D8D41
MADPHTVHLAQAPWPDRGPDVTVPAGWVRVRIRARFRDGYVGEVLGWVTAWPRRAVECVFFHPDPDI